jgi:3-methyladenine DNA glycosylase AlkD
VPPDHPPTADRLIAALRSHASPVNVAGMARYGIRTDTAFGVPIVIIRGIAKQVGKSHALARDLWKSGIHEARHLATMVEELDRVTPGQMDRWARDFNSWDICDQACHNLFRFTPHAWPKAKEWAHADREFVKRAGFSLMAGLAVKDKAATDGQFEALFPLIAEAASDDRNMVKKAVNWALRQIGKRNSRLRKKAIAAARTIHSQGTSSARWIASDALRELLKESPPIRNKTREAQQ